MRQIRCERVQVRGGNSGRARERFDRVRQLRETVDRLDDLRRELNCFRRNLDEVLRLDRRDQVFNDRAKRFYRRRNVRDVVAERRDDIDRWRQLQPKLGQERAGTPAVLEPTDERSEQTRQAERNRFQRSLSFVRRRHGLMKLNRRHLCRGRRE